MERVPISSLSPDQAPGPNAFFKAVVTLLWPFSSATDQCALLLADPDFRQRYHRGQVRVRFSGPVAKALAGSKIGIGDEVEVALEGARWVQEDAGDLRVKAPGKGVEGELVYDGRLRMKISRAGEESRVLDVDEEVAAVPVSPQRGYTGSSTPAIHTPARSSLGQTNNFAIGVYSSPAFMKRLRLSEGEAASSPYTPVSEDDDLDTSSSRKRRRVSYKNVSEWKFDKREPSPEDQDGEAEYSREEQQSQSIDQQALPATGTASEDVKDASAMATPSRNTVLPQESQQDGQVVPHKGSHPPATASGQMAPPPSLPRLQMPPKFQVFSEQPLTPRLQPVPPENLPLPSPFPTSTEPLSTPILQLEPDAASPETAEPEAQDVEVTHTAEPDSASPEETEHPNDLPQHDGASDDVHSLSPVHSKPKTEENEVADEAGADSASPVQAKPTSPVAQHDSTPQGFAPERARSPSPVRLEPETVEAIPVQEEVLSPGDAMHDDEQVAPAEQAHSPSEGSEADVSSEADADHSDEDAEDVQQQMDTGDRQVLDDRLLADAIEVIQDEPEEKMPASRIDTDVDMQDATQEENVSDTEDKPDEMYFYPKYSDDETGNENEDSEESDRDEDNDAMTFVPGNGNEDSEESDRDEDNDAMTFVPDEYTPSERSFVSQPAIEPAPLSAEQKVRFSFGYPAYLDNPVDAKRSVVVADESDGESGTSQDEEAAWKARDAAIHTLDLRRESTTASKAEAMAGTTSIQHSTGVDQAEPTSTKAKAEVIDLLSDSDDEVASVEDQLHVPAQKHANKAEQNTEMVGEVVDEPTEPEVAETVDHPDISGAEVHDSTNGKPTNNGEGSQAPEATEPLTDVLEPDAKSTAEVGHPAQEAASPAGTEDIGLVQQPTSDSVQREADDAQRLTTSSFRTLDPATIPGEETGSEALSISAEDTGLSQHDCNARPSPGKPPVTAPVPDSVASPVTTIISGSSRRNSRATSTDREHVRPTIPAITEPTDSLHTVQDTAIASTRPADGQSVSDAIGDKTKKSARLDRQTAENATSADDAGNAQIPVREVAQGSSSAVDRPDDRPGLISPRVIPASLHSDVLAGSENRPLKPLPTDGPHSESATEQITDTIDEVETSSDPKQATATTSSEHKVKEVPKQAPPEPSSATKHTRNPRRSLAARMSDVPDVISAWFAPRRSSMLVTSTPEKKEREIEDAGPPKPDQRTPRKPSVSPPPLSRLASQGTVTALSYYAPLTALEGHLNQADGAVDIMAISTTAASDPVRAKAYPKDFFTVFHILDPALREYNALKSDANGAEDASTNDDAVASSPADHIRVDIFRPWKAYLPTTSPGDVVLLRNFAVRSQKHKIHLLSRENSSWAVWRYSDLHAHTDATGVSEMGTGVRERRGSVKEEVRGPPVEIGAQERERARELRRWWEECVLATGQDVVGEE